jgi:hypothetical protein
MNVPLLTSIVVGVTQLLKRVCKMDDNASIITACMVGLLVFGPHQAIDMGLMPEVAIPWVEWATAVVGLVLAIPGLFDVLKTEVISRAVDAFEAVALSIATLKD